MTIRPEPQDFDQRMPLLAHLKELRDRLIRAVLGLVVGSLVGAFIATPVMEYLQSPYGEPFITLGPTDSVIAYFRVTLLIGAVLSIPIITWQVLMFILPALTRKERNVLLISLPVITLLFVVGVVFAWFILVPPAIGFLGGFQPTLFRPNWTADLYLSFVTALLFWMGVAFQTPLIFFVTAFLGFVTARTLIRNWRIAVIGSSVAAAIITPTIDPVNMFLVMAPLLTLYVLSIGLVALARRISPVKTESTFNG